MTVYVSLLRGINVGGHKKIKMAELRALYSRLGLADVRSLLQSGNVIFRSDGGPNSVREGIEAAIESAYGFRVDVILRRADEFAAALAQHPFNEAELAEPAKVALHFLAQMVDETQLAELPAKYIQAERLTLRGDTLYIFFAEGMGRSKLSNAVIEKALRTNGTTRNWNTCNKILKLINDLEGTA